MASKASSRVRVVFTVNGEPVPVKARVPEGPVRLDQLLPALLAMDDRLIDVAVAGLKDERVSCAKGCSACCRAQPVPVTPPETYALSRLVAALPEPRRTSVRAAFATAVERLRAAGLYDAYMRRDPQTTREEAIAVTRRYFVLKIACPFLVDDACGIYVERPFVCRQYLVTSPPELCAAPLDNPVKPVRTPAAFATAMLQAGEALSGRPQHTVPLVLALEYAEAHGEELAKSHDAKTAFGRVMQALTG